MADLGEGTFAFVEQAELRLPGGRPPRAVAVKRLRTALIEGDQELLDFVREGALLKRLRHPCASANRLSKPAALPACRAAISRFPLPKQRR